MTSPGSPFVHPTFDVVAAPDEWKAAADAVTHEQFSDRDARIFTFHEKILPLLREQTDTFRNVNPSANQWKSGSVGIRGVSVTYGPRQTSVFVQIWFSKVNAAGSNRAGLEVLDRHRIEVESELAGYELDWRSNGTGILAVIVEGIGYTSEPSDDKMAEVAAVARKMAELIHRYRTEIAAAMNLPQALPE